MTDEPTQDNPPTAVGGNPAPAGLPPESRAARSLTDRSKAQEPHTDEPHTEPDPVSGPRLWPRVVGVLILLIGAGGVWIWQNPGFVQSSMRSLFPGFAGHDTAAAEIKALADRVTRLEQRSSPADLSSPDLARRLDALEQRLPPPGQPPVDLRPLLARLNALEARSVDSRSAAPQPASPPTASAPVPGGVPGEPDLQPVLARLDALEQQQTRSAVDPARVDALASRVDALAAREPADVRGKLDDVEHRLSDLAASQMKLASSSDRAARIAQWEAADMALAAGKPLGTIPDAPPALTRFATTAPPTDAALRLAFVPTSQAALKVSQPDTEGKPFLDRVMARLQDSGLITVREGDHVVIGNSTAATLSRARVLLDAGDLAGAAREVSALSGPPAEKMAPWLADAKALQAAREALASLAESG
jgi:hypothetical protein